MEKQCLNCGNPIDAKYCKNCGQSSATQRLTIKSIIKNYLSSAFSIEGAFIRTIILLFKNPGLLFREYIIGKRKTFYNPISFFILLTGLYIILRSTFNYDPLENIPLSNLHGQEKSINEAARFMFANINYFLIFFVLSIGLMLKLFYRGKYNFAEYLITGFYIAGFFLIFSISGMIINHFSSINLNKIQLLLLFLPLFYSLLSFFKIKKVTGLLKCIIVSVLIIGFYIMLGFSFSILITQL